MKGMDQGGVRFQEKCTLRLPGTSTQCRHCFSTIAAFQVEGTSFIDAASQDMGTYQKRP